MENILNVKKWSYFNYSSDNYGANSIAIRMGSRTVYFSYDTIIAFKGYNSTGEYFNCVHVNDWSTTTGKHINFIDGGNKKTRLEDGVFQKKLQEFLL